MSFPQSGDSDSRCLSPTSRTVQKTPTGKNNTTLHTYSYHRDPPGLVRFSQRESVSSLHVLCRSISGQQGASEHKPSLEDTVDSLFRRLREKRRALGLPDNMKVCFTGLSLLRVPSSAVQDLTACSVFCVQEMTQAQMVLEKITLQKCLLYFENLHGRPVSSQQQCSTCTQMYCSSSWYLPVTAGLVVRGDLFWSCRFWA